MGRFYKLVRITTFLRETPLRAGQQLSHRPSPEGNDYRAPLSDLLTFKQKPEVKAGWRAK